MRRLLFLALALAAPFGTTAALGQAPRPATPPSLAIEPKPAERTPGPQKAETRRPSTLDDLFARLAAAADETEAKGIENLIERRLARSGSDTADLLMSRAVQALEAKDAPLAIELLDRVTQLRPGWAEAWHRRAAAFYMLEDPADAMADLHKALSAEPRHFAAWAALGHVYMAGGDKRRALEAYRKALALHPFLEDAKKVVDRISPEVEGRDL
ncbi:tetratricopeptide repeat protein [Enterovirga aerilata]|uniref:Tetratricopeptide repeat protein n=1 Tax=Enterovirga aerilata TaxID=2730920 RepID=A0A849IBT9_9HYPH|nr:tetratricopeptide repeat protein [Enterovirga sp. DB1703]NNM71393.1 tetratricopeptide repeat protein [Enterovirga sp. DB1703]